MVQEYSTGLLHKQLQDQTPTTAARLGGGFLGAVVLGGIASTFMSSDFLDEFEKALIHTRSGLRGGLHKRAPVALGQFLAFDGCDLTRSLQIALVTNNNHWKSVSVLHAQNCVAKLSELLETAAIGNRINNQEALARTNLQKKIKKSIGC